MTRAQVRGRTVCAAAATGALLATLGAGPAGAGWPSTGQVSTGAVSAAVVDHGFTVVGGAGTGGRTYSAAVPMGGTTVGYVDLVNVGTVPVTLRGTVSLSSVLHTTTTITGCSAAWSAGACPGTSTTLMPSTPLVAQVEVTWHPSALAVGAAVHLRVSVQSSVPNQVTLTATASPTRAPQDRTSA